MAELQWIVEVRCTNALLAEMKIGEKGEHVIVNVPDRNFDPSEFDKLIQGLEVSSRIAAENRRSSKNLKIERASADRSPSIEISNATKAIACFLRKPIVLTVCFLTASKNRLNFKL